MKGKKHEKLEKQLRKHPPLAWLVTYDFLSLQEDYLGRSVCIPWDCRVGRLWEARAERTILSLEPFPIIYEVILRNGRRKQNGVPSVFRRWVAWEVTPRLVTLSPTHLLFLPPLAQPRPFQTPSLFCTSCLHSLWPSYLSRNLQRGETLSPPTLQLLRGSSSETGHAQRGASSLRCLGGAAQRRAGTECQLSPGFSTHLRWAQASELRPEAKPAAFSGSSSIFNLLSHQGLEIVFTEGPFSHLSFLCS